MTRGLAADRPAARAARRMAGGTIAGFAAAAGLAILAPLTAAAQGPGQPPQAQAPTPFPGGAQAVNETYQDWQMVCGQAQGVKQCAVAQQQTDGKTGQRVLGVELRPRGDKAEGLLLLPFGLTLDKGVSLRIGEAEIAPALRFKTCLMGGCVVPLNLDAKAMAALRKAPALTVAAFGDSEQPVAFTVSLKGFGPALDRAAALAR